MTATREADIPATGENHLSDNSQPSRETHISSLASQCCGWLGTRPKLTGQ